tara:strand:+ start:143 stop:568 length:426 start_codon:yes stop_codon:yes gene_type:complete
MKKNRIIIFMLTCFICSTLYAKDSYYEEGKKFFDKKNFKESKFFFEKDIVFNPKSEKSYLYLAKIFKVEESDKLLENNLNTVLLLNPKNEEAIYLLTLLNIKQSNFSKTKELIETMNLICKKKCSLAKELQEKLDVSLKSK